METERNQQSAEDATKVIRNAQSCTAKVSATALLADWLLRPPCAESRWIASYILHLSPGELRVEALRGRRLRPEERIRWLAVEKKRRRGWPLQYAIGRWNFFGRDFRVDPRALIPRPETERLVEEALQAAQERRADLETERSLRVADIGTGSGCIAITMALERTDLQLWATDCSAAALSLARENAELLGGSALSPRLFWAQGDLLDPLSGAYDLIVSNPPYVEEKYRDELASELFFEPQEALFAGEDGLAVYRRLIPQAEQKLLSGGVLLLEIGAEQAPAILALFDSAGWDDRRVIRDYTGRARVVRARRSGGGNYV